MLKRIVKLIKIAFTLLCVFIALALYASATTETPTEVTETPTEVVAQITEETPPVEDAPVVEEATVEEKKENERSAIEILRYCVDMSNNEYKSELNYHKRNVKVSIDQYEKTGLTLLDAGLTPEQVLKNGSFIHLKNKAIEAHRQLDEVKAKKETIFRACVAEENK